MWTFFLVIQIVGVFLTVLAIHSVIKVSPSKSQVYLLMTLICALIYSLAYTMEFCSTSQSEALAFLKMEYLGCSFVVTFYLAFILEYCGYKFPRPLLYSLLAFGLFTCVLVFTCEYNSLYYTSYSFVNEGTHYILKLEHGLFYYIRTFTIVLSYAAAFYVVIKSMKNEEKDHRGRFYCLLVSEIVPVVPFALLVFGVSKHIDAVSFTMIITCLLLLICMKRYHFLDIVEGTQKMLIRNMVDAVIVADENLRYLESNLAAKQLFPQLSEYKTGSRMDDKLHALFADKNKNARFIKDGKTYFVTNNTVTVNGRKLGYNLLFVDITEQSEMLEEMRRLKEEAEDATRAKTKFLANMSHEIRTPIDAMLGYNVLLSREADNKEKVLEYSANIESAGKSLLSIIKEILDFSKIEAGKMEIVMFEYDVACMLSDLVSMFSVKAFLKNLDFVLDINDRIPSRLYGDEGRIKEIATNLLSNAVKFTQKGSVSLSVKFSEESLVISVSDTGIGIKKEDMDKLFASYRRIQEKRNRDIEGSGLGLCIVMMLINMMNGRLEFSSEYEKGSVFTAYIPQKIINASPIGSLGDACGRIMKDHKVFKASFTVPKAKILVVDDNEMNLNVTAGLLEPYRASVTAAPGGLEAISFLEKGMRYDIIFMDHMMPKPDGIETTELIRNMEGDYFKNVPIIALTANAVSGAKALFLGNGMQDYLTKPVDLTKLEECLKTFLPKEYIIPNDNG